MSADCRVAALCMKSALTLSAVLGLHLSHHADPRTAIAAYESARRARVDRVVKWGKRMGDAKTAGPVARRIRDLTFPLVTALGSRPSVVRRQAWLYDHHIEWRGQSRVASRDAA